MKNPRSAFPAPVGSYIAARHTQRYPDCIFTSYSGLCICSHFNHKMFLECMLVREDREEFVGLRAKIAETHWSKNLFG